MSNNNPNSKKIISYKDSGVDIEKGNQLVNEIKNSAKSTFRPEVLGGIGGFGSLFKMPNNYKKPVLVSGTDGVGTKLKIAIETGLHDGIGIDLVAMCVNDLIVAGAEPLFFLDYYATDKLEIKTAKTVIESIAKGCQMSGASLIGGETAEMPGMYKSGDYDLAGFCVGIVEHEEIIDGNKISAGDTVLALSSSGPHSNGYSLIRKIIEESKVDINAPFSLGRPKLSAISLETGVICTPNQPLFVLPNSLSCFTILSALFEGIAKPKPILPPV